MGVDRLALILLSWGIAGVPCTAGTVTSHTPKLFFVMGLALLSQLSASLSNAIQGPLDPVSTLKAHTEITDQRRLHCIGRPFPVFDVAIWLRIETEDFIALEENTIDDSQCQFNHNGCEGTHFPPC